VRHSCAGCRERVSTSGIEKRRQSGQSGSLPFSRAWGITAAEWMDLGKSPSITLQFRNISNSLPFTRLFTFAIRLDRKRTRSITGDIPDAAQQPPNYKPHLPDIPRCGKATSACLF
jgi:hypothetical protein